MGRATRIGEGGAAHRHALGVAIYGIFLSVAVSAQAADLPSKAPRNAAAVAPTPQWTATIASEFRYYAWKGDVGSPSGVNGNAGSGTQIYVPYAIQLARSPHEFLKVELLGRGGWVRSQQSTAGLSGSVSTMTDTVVSGTVTYLGIDGIQPFVSLNANLPSGRSALFGAAANSRMDPDLVEISTFGEGWNIGPTLGFNAPLTPSVVVTLAAGYTWRGAFNRESSLAATPGAAQTPLSIDPGDVFTGTASIAFKHGPWSASLLGSVSEETETSEAGDALYKAGRRYVARASVGFQWPESFGVTTLNGSLAQSNRNDVRFLGASALVTEPMNTNAKLYRVGVEHLMPFGRLWLGPVASYLHRSNNSYDPMTLQFVPAKDRYAAGLVARYAASEAVTFNLRAERIWTKEDERDAINGQQFSVLANAFVLGSAVPVVSSTGWQVGGGINVKF